MLKSTYYKIRCIVAYTASAFLFQTIFIVFVGLQFHWLKKQSELFAEEQSIAFFVNSPLRFVHSLIDGATEYLQIYGPHVKYKIFYYHQNKMLLNQQINEALQSKYKLFVSIGTMASQTAHEMLLKRKADIPLLFSYVINPTDIGLAKAHNYTGFNSTGLAEQYAQDRTPHFVKALLTVRPTTKNAIIIYTSGIPMLQEQVECLLHDLTKANINTTTIPIDNCKEVYDKARDRITTKTDAVIILRDYTTLDALQSLIKICNYTKTTLFTSDKYSVTDGAAASFGIDEYDAGKVLGCYIKKIVVDNIPAKDLKILYFNSQNFGRLYINPTTMQKQGVTTPLDTLVKKHNAIAIS